jgi:hypothetical protein
MAKPSVILWMKRAMKTENPRLGLAWFVAYVIKPSGNLCSAIAMLVCKPIDMNAFSGTWWWCCASTSLSSSEEDEELRLQGECEREEDWHASLLPRLAARVERKAPAWERARCTSERLP